jgi:thioredoxin 1
MKKHSYYALILLLSCIAPITVMQAASDETESHRGGSVRDAGSAQEVNAIIAANDLVVVYFYATWCGPCKRMAPEFAKLPSKVEGVVFVKVNVDLPGITDGFGIRSMPTLYCYKGGQKVSQVSGAKSLNDLINYVKGAFGL